MKEKEFLIAGLNNAYSMEKGIETALLNMASNLKEFPIFQRAVKNHIAITKNQARAVAKRIKELGGEVSTTKKIISQVVSTLQGLGIKMMPYKSLKILGMAYATESLEMSTYRQLKIIADSIGDNTTARLCKKISSQEQAMAKIIERITPQVVRRELFKETKSARHEERRFF